MVISHLCGVFLAKFLRNLVDSLTHYKLKKKVLRYLEAVRRYSAFDTLSLPIRWIAKRNCNLNNSAVPNPKIFRVTSKCAEAYGLHNWWTMSIYSFSQFGAIEHNMLKIVSTSLIPLITQKYFHIWSQNMFHFVDPYQLFKFKSFWERPFWFEGKVTCLQTWAAFFQHKPLFPAYFYFPFFSLPLWLPTLKIISVHQKKPILRLGSLPLSRDPDSTAKSPKHNCVLTSTFKGNSSFAMASNGLALESIKRTIASQQVSLKAHAD